MCQISRLVTVKLLVFTSLLLICLLSHFNIKAQNCKVQDSLSLVSVLSGFSTYDIDTSQPISQWSGVSLNEDGCIISIDFSNCCISGGILSPSIGNITSLEYLNLNKNDIGGFVPNEIGDLINLSYLNLSENNFESVIPPDIGKLDNIKYLNLGENNFSGTIPDEIGDLIQLNYFNVCSSQLEGNVPEALGNLNNLTSLYLFDNNLSGCYETSLSNLCLNLSDETNTNKYISRGNNFDASWEEFCMYGFGSCSCRYADSLNLITFFTSLQQDFDVNQPLENWFGITLNENGCVSKIDITDRSYSGYIGPEIGNFSELVFLKLNENRITGLIPTEIGNLTKLEYLSLTENWLSGTIPASFSNLTSLNSLFLDENNLSGCYDASLTSLCSISSYSISDENNFDGTWDAFCMTGANECLACHERDSLALLTVLSNFEAHTINTSLPLESWSGITLNDEGCITRIDWSECCIYGGTLSESIGDLLALEYLNMSEGEVGGEIPEELGYLPNLRFLHLSDNAFVGNIPIQLSYLYNLEKLNLRTNMLSGSIPSELGNLNSLHFLSLGNNFLTGQIPSTFSQFDNLLGLSLTNNNLSGCYDQNLTVLCNVISNNQIGFGNDFDAEWEDFCLNGTGVCIEDLNCSEYLHVDNLIAEDLNRQANSFITSDAKILSGNANFFAGEYIELFPEFEVTVNTTFLATIKDCE